MMMNEADSEQVLDVEEDHGMQESSDEEGGEGDEGSQPGGSDHQDNEVDDSVHCFTGHTEPVFSVAWHRSHPRLVASGSGDDKAYLWQTGMDDYTNLEDTTVELRGHTDSVACLQFNAEGTLLASGGLDGQVRIWRSEDGSCVQSLEGPSEGIEWLDWHPKGTVLLAGSQDFTVWMWNATSGACMQVFTGHSGPVRCGRFTPDGKSVVTGGGEGDDSLKVWDPRNGACTLTIHDNHLFHSAGLTFLDIRPDSMTVCSGSEDHTARLVNLQTGRILGCLSGHTESVEAVAFLGDSPLVATCSLDNTLKIWDVSTFALRTTCNHEEAVIGMVCHPLQPIVYTSCLDGCVRSWDVRTGECLQTNRGHKDGIQAIAVSPDGKHVLTGSDDCTARIFEFGL